eukprot:gb/GECG01009567.1/.p1 GENE.gb/GECG01009567.1/~~gb/GECG01009567.1/.p1  ORF type:complete len:4452 (+),score=647.06 gb/GECG01009567.1/:1-13356(+)
MPPANQAASDKNQALTNDKNAAAGGEDQILQDTSGVLHWFRASCSGDVPLKRSGHSLTVVGNNAYLFGGLPPKKPVGPSNEMFRVQIPSGGSKKEFKWVKVSGTTHGEKESKHGSKRDSARFQSARDRQSSSRSLESEQYPSDIPLPRWKHSASAFGKNKIAIFGGLHSTNSRLSDLWVFDAQKSTWENPWPSLYEIDKQGNHAPKKESDPNLEESPTPRGGHSSATLLESTILIFGGHGGAYFSRKDFNDLYAYDTEKSSFKKLTPKGKPPAPRSGHTAVGFGSKMLVFGGWNNRSQLADLWLYEWYTNTWTQIETQQGLPRWNHAAVGIASIPYSKMLLFGGSVASPNSARAQGVFSSEVMLLDRIDASVPEGAMLDESVEYSPRDGETAAMLEQAQWIDVKNLNFDGKPPSAREDCGMAFDPKGSRVLIFGGWTNRWHGDLHVLDMQQLVGPPYAVTGIEPKMGPVTGGEAIRIYGEGFNGDDVAVRFIAKNPRTGKFDEKSASEDTRAKRINETELSCDAPNFESHGPSEVQVRVSIGGDAYTTTYQKYQFFSVTDAHKSLAFGPGLMPGAIANRPTSFVIQSKDDKGLNRITGGDEFRIDVVRLQEKEEQEQKLADNADDPTKATVEKLGLFKGCLDTSVAGPSVSEFLGEESHSSESKNKDRELNGQKMDYTIHDNEDGTYEVSYTPTSAGEYIVRINFVGTYGGVEGPVRGSPFHPLCYADDTSNIKAITCALKADENGGRLSASASKELSQLSEDDMGSEINDLSGPLLSALVRRDLQEIANFLKSSLNGLKEEPSDDDLNGLLRVKEHLLAANKNKQRIDFVLDRATSVMQYRAALFSGGRHSPLIERKGLSGKSDPGLGRNIEGNLTRTKEQFQNLERQIPITKGAIQPLVKSHGTVVRNEMLQYEERIQNYADSLKTKEFMYWDTGMEKSREALQETKKKQETMWSELKEKYHTASVFDFPEVLRKSMESMRNIDSTLDNVEHLWDLAEEADTFFKQSKETLWTEVDADKLEDDAKSLQKKVTSTINAQVKNSGAFKGLLKSVREFLNTMPLVQALRHPSMRMRHWEMLQKATGQNFTPPPNDPDLKLEGLLALQLHRFQTDVEEITDQAMKEAQMEATLDKLESTWSSIQWDVSEIELAGDKVETVKLVEEDMEQLENDQLAVQGMMGSRFKGTFEEKIDSWNTKLGRVAEVVSYLTDVARTWAYLEPLFLHSEEVKKELPEDADRFVSIDSSVRKILKDAVATKNVVESCNAENVLEELEKQNTELDKCRKSLQKFLDQKRRLFPRFYFVSEADLLDILSNGSNPPAIMRHISKVLLATAKLRLKTENEGRPVATEFVSGVGEEILPFRQGGVRLEGKAEQYLAKILEEQHMTIQDFLMQAYKRYDEMNRGEWMIDFKEDVPEEDKGIVPVDPAQIVSLVASAKYIEQAEAALKRAKEGDSNAVKEYNKKQNEELAELIRLTRRDLSKAKRTRVMVSITMDSHSRDVIEKLVADGINDPDSFQWQSQLKHRILDDGSCRIDILNASFPYGNEYLGNGPRLVITPLTDRIYVTATQALNLCMGCAPAGPAGTGKTETTKDLSSALGKCCYVFNCSPEMDYQTLGDIFKGLASSGSWGCFDEFNRLIPEVLSVCSVQFKSVCDAIRATQDTVTIENDTVTLDRSAGVFITMNPGYLGRSELPEGLKALFRPITVMVPDLVLICENMLMAEGFEDAKVLARKFYGLYSLLGELLSKQPHYDWGLRAVKSVLVVAGGFKRAEPDMPEQDLLMRALRDFNIPKIIKQDEVVFYGLLGDLFPGVNPPRKRDQDLENAVDAAGHELQLNPSEEFALKVVQLEEILDVRHCIFVMGPPGCGKSKTWKTLAKARGKLDKDRTTKCVDLNPKAVQPEDLYGYVHPATREWKDGLLSKTMRDLGTETPPTPKWIILDGDLDANWIESMNSVMDDNRMLTLANNERIPLKNNMRMLFEIRDLNYASPATVSRAGIIYISTEGGFQWRNLVKSWLMYGGGHAFPLPVRKALHSMFEHYVEPTLLYHKKTLQPIVNVQETGLVGTLTEFLTHLLPSPDLCRKLAKKEETDEEGEASKQSETVGDSYFQPFESLAKVIYKHLGSEDDQAELSDSEYGELEGVFAFSAVWAFGSMCAEKDGVDWRRQFSDFWRANFKGLRFPSRDTVFDYWLDPEGHLQPWKAHPSFQAVDFDSRTQQMSNVFVPTPETVSITFWARHLFKAKRPLMLAGYAGCGKTAILQGLLNSSSSENTVQAAINFNFYTDAYDLQGTMETFLEKKAGTTYGPPPGKDGLVFFVDDLNLPELDPYNTQSAIALLRQHMDYEHWYDRFKLATKHVVDCQYVAGMNPTAGSFQVNPRLQRHFTTFAVGFPGALSLLTIYQTFLDGHLRRFNDEVGEISSHLINGALALHHAVASTFKKSARNFHYEFNIRHLSSVFQGIMAAEPAQFQEPVKLVRLWLHESERVYGDRLVSEEDLEKYRQLAVAQVKKRFPQYSGLTSHFAGENPDPLLFCHFVESIHEPVYDQVTSMSSLTNIVSQALQEHNESYATMDLVLFEDAVKHVCRVSRILNSPAGHALLVGVGGSGKQSLARLAAFICSATVQEISVSANYTENDFKDDLRSIYYKAGVKDEKVMFFLRDSHITNERFLVYLNDVLASGNVPDLYGQEDADEVVNDGTSKAKAAGYATDRESVWRWFLAQVRHNLHVVLCFSPGEQLRVRALRFPAVVNCTTIDWFHPWPRDALMSVADRFMSKVEDLSDPAIKSGVVNFMPYALNSVNEVAHDYKVEDGRYAYTTPKSFLEGLEMYQNLLDKKKSEAESQITRLSNGVDKLRETAAAVEKIEADLKVSLEQAEEKKSTAEGIQEKVSAERENVARETATAEEERKKTEELQAEVETKRANCEKDLEQAEPMLENAQKALDTLNKKDLGECKSMIKPPNGVDDIFSATTVLLAGIHPEIPVAKSGKVKPENRDWDAAKKFLMKDIQGFLDQLKSYKEHIDNFEVPAVNFKEVRPYLELEHFKPETIEGRNKMAAGLCSWVINIVQYYDVLMMVTPKREALREANEKLDHANERLKEVQDKVAELQEQLDKLTKDLEEADKEKQKAQEEVENGQQRLNLAQRLTRALSDEEERWCNGIDQLRTDQKTLIGDVLLASAFVSYAGPFSSTYRRRLVEQWWVPFMKKAADGESLPLADEPSPLRVLTTDAEIAGWQGQGLPADSLSTENGAIVKSTSRWPLLLDPQLQGISWLKNYEGEELFVSRIDRSDLIQKLSMCIEEGKSVLLENVGESINPMLWPVITRSTVKKGRKQMLMLAGKELQFSEDFKLYLHTKLSNPHYPPEVQAECTLINFTITREGLEEQLLSLTVSKERSDLAEQRKELIQQQNYFKVKMKELEDDILQKLAEAEGDVTEDVELIESLENAKSLSTDIAKKMQIASQTQKEIAETSEKYRSVASRCALLFFMLMTLDKVHTYYVHSLQSFVRVVVRAIDNTPHEDLGQGEESGEQETMEAAPEQPAKESEEKPEDKKNDEEGKEEDEGKEEKVEEEKDEKEDEEKEETVTKQDAPPQLTDEQLQRRCKNLCDNITSTVFKYVRRGLFDHDKLMVASLLTLKIACAEGDLHPSAAAALVRSDSVAEPESRGILSEWLSFSLWSKIKALESLSNIFPKLGNIGEDMQLDGDMWQAWYDHEVPETAKLPGKQKNCSMFERLLLLRAMRPDRLPSALKLFISKQLGDEYVNDEALDMGQVYSETSKTTPVFFVLFPGVDPTPWVEELGKTKGITHENGKFVNISMGQGQEKHAENCLKQFVEEGGWLMLQNVHLMQSWLPLLERQLELESPNAHEDFRCFISAEPPPLSYMKNMPESLMQDCIKIANEAATDVRSNLTRALHTFTEDRVENSSKPVAFKSCLFGLCFFHSVLLGRRRFGSQGWSKRYSFNQGDLMICADVLQKYLEESSAGDSADAVPWQDLRYIFGEIMYGGHITDWWDRRTNRTYLETLFTPKLLEGLDLAPACSWIEKSEDPDNPEDTYHPGFAVPSMKDMKWEDASHYVYDHLPEEQPQIYGLHPNSEINWLQTTTDTLFTDILHLEGAEPFQAEAPSTGESEEDQEREKEKQKKKKSDEGGSGNIVTRTLEDLLERLPESFPMVDIQMRAEPMLKTENSPYVVVALQECTRMNALLDKIRDSLTELRKGLDGQLNMTDAMEDLSEALSLNQVPGRNPFHKTSWEKLAWFSRRNLSSWFNDLLDRVKQLDEWSQTLELPYATWISGLFNPTAFLTAVMQVTARRNGYPLDAMTVDFHATFMQSPEEVEGYPSDGAFIYGLYMEGARFRMYDDDENEIEPYEEGDTKCGGCIRDSLLKQLLPPMPVMYVRAVQVQPTWEPESVGYLRNDPKIYESPVYSTTARGPTYVCLATLKTVDPPSKWVLAGVSLVLQTDD